MTFTLFNCYVPSYASSFIRLSDFRGADQQAVKALEAIRDHDCGWFYVASPDDFKKIPGSPIAYWASPKLLEAFEDGLSLGKLGRISEGIKTGDNNKFLRLWFEVDHWLLAIDAHAEDIDSLSKEKRWFPHHKGGDYRRWYGNFEYVIEWQNNGEKLKAAPNSGFQGRENYFKSGITWTKLSSSHFGVRYLPEGVLFDSGSPAFFPNSKEYLQPFLAYLSSKLVSQIIKSLNPTLNFQVGNVALLPILLSQMQRNLERLKHIPRDCISLAKQDWDSFETSWDFQTLPILRDQGADAPRSVCHTLFQSQAVADAEALARFQRMKHLETENNRHFIDAYGLQDKLSPEVPDDQITLCRPNREEDIKRLISYAIGCMMGRYSLDKPGLIYAHSGNKDFDPSQYQTFPVDDDGIVPMMETDWFPDDASNRLVEFIRVAWPKERLAENLTFIADSLGPNHNEQPRDTIRRYLATGFYKHHLAMYKRRPIYWLFSSGKHRAFQCLVYLHRYHEGTLSRMRTEYVIPLQGKIASRMDQLADDIAAASSTSHRKKLEKERDTLRKQHTELQVFDEQLRHYADRRISLDLDDGVKVNYGKFGDLLAEVTAVTGATGE